MSEPTFSSKIRLTKCAPSPPSDEPTGCQPTRSTESFQPMQFYPGISIESTIPRHFNRGNITLAEPSPLYTIPWPSHLRFAQSLGRAVYTLQNPSAKPSPLYTVPGPSRLLFIQSLGPAMSNLHIPGPSRLHFMQSLGRAISTLQNPSAEPSPLYTFRGLSRLLFTQSLGRAVSTLHIPWAEPSPLYTIPRPSRLHFTHS